MDLIEEVLQLLITLTKINQRINRIGLGVQDENKQVTWLNSVRAGNPVCTETQNITYWVYAAY